MTVYTPNSTGTTSSSTDVKASQGRRHGLRTAEKGTFRSLLEGQQPAGVNTLRKEKGSTQVERSAHAGQKIAGGTVDTGFSVNPRRRNETAALEAAAASTLLRLNALSASRPGGLMALSTGGEVTERLLAPLARVSMLRNAASSSQMGRSSMVGLGSLSAQFESGEAGIAAIGYDGQGGTSYGQYQISSRAGTMSDFLDFLDERAPEWAKELRAAGPTNTGGRGGSMPREWRRIAAEHPDRFAALQRAFIERTHYQPALEEIREKTGVDIGSQPKALREVLWSTAVQHGAKGAAKLFCKVIDKSEGAGTLSAQKMIDDLYSARGDQFGGSTAGVRAAVRNRFQEERRLAQSMLTGSGGLRRTTA
jgi:hypothetical protein